MATTNWWMSVNYISKTPAWNCTLQFVLLHQLNSILTPVSPVVSWEGQTWLRVSGYRFDRPQWYAGMSYTTPRRRRILMTRNNLTLFPNISKRCGCYIDVFGTPLAGLRSVDSAVLPLWPLHRYGRHLLHRLNLQSRRHQHGQVSYSDKLCWVRARERDRMLMGHWTEVVPM